MTDDGELLRRYAQDGSEGAFRELVDRHLAALYRSALRMTGGNAALAEDATQTALILLARKAPTLRRHPSVIGWLHTTVHRCRS